MSGRPDPVVQRPFSVLVKRALVRAFWIALGTAIGGGLLSRMSFSNLPQPPIAKQLLVCFAGGYVGAFLVYLLLEIFGRQKQALSDGGWAENCDLPLDNRQSWCFNRENKTVDGEIKPQAHAQRAGNAESPDGTRGGQMDSRGRDEKVQT